jgi:hypothetical protein
VGLADLYPEFFRGRFTTPDGGLFPDKAAVTLTKDSEKKTYWVNYLDVAQSTLFPGKKSNSHGGVYWWPSLVESAIQSWYADHGQLDALSSGGYPSDSIELLTGVKSAQWMEDEAATWTRFQRGNKIPVVITTKPNSTRTLISFHAYTISLAEEKNGVKWVTVRNPWHETQRHKFEDVYADISSVGHYVDVDATPTNDV